MVEEKLLENLSKLGLPMFEPEVVLDVNYILAEVVKSRSLRLWEGFPVLLANAAGKFAFSIEQVNRQLSTKKQKDIFHQLVLMSGALFSFFHLSFPWWNKIKKEYSKQDKSLIVEWKKGLTHNRVIKIHDVLIDPKRLKGTFELYYEQKAENDKRRKDKYEEFSLEYSLSQIFSPKQKELFLKKLEGTPLSKTEKEYYSRRVKKKVTALANSEMHSLAKKVLGI